VVVLVLVVPSLAIARTMLMTVPQVVVTLAVPSMKRLQKVYGSRRS
jgi:hypothetical protein